MKTQKFHLIARFTTAVLGFVLLSFVFLTGRREILYAGAGFVCLAAAVQSVGKPAYLVPAGCSPVITRPDIYCHPENPGHNPAMRAGIAGTVWFFSICMHIFQLNTNPRKSR
jgi:hypothetical protein